VKRTTTICVLSVLCLSGEPFALAGSLGTTFAISTFIGETEVPQAIPTQPGKRMTLPSAFANWNCSVTTAFYSNDGTQVYHNVTCQDPNTSLTFGMSVQCPTRVEGSDANAFFMRTTDAYVSFIGKCLTRSQAPLAPVPTVHL
jgi:hypothetical protein